MSLEDRLLKGASVLAGWLWRESQFVHQTSLVPTDLLPDHHHAVFRLPDEIVSIFIPRLREQIVLLGSGL